MYKKVSGRWWGILLGHVKFDLLIRYIRTNNHSAIGLISMQYMQQDFGDIYLCDIEDISLKVTRASIDGDK